MRRTLWLALGLILLTGCEQTPGGLCGNGVLEAGEACDDGNPNSGDGCRMCNVEEGWQCHAEPSECCTLHWQGPNCTGPCVVFVDGAVQTATEDGLSWTTAFAHLQDGIDTARRAGPGCELWVASGTYSAWQQGHADTFELPSHTALYGGFVGTEATRDERDWHQTPTVLDGRRDGHPEERVHHVLTTTETTGVIIDGFAITGGDAENSYGGGLYAQDATVLVQNCLFTENHAGEGGGLAATGFGAIDVIDSRFLGNIAEQFGGGLTVDSHTTARIENCELDENRAQSGGALAASRAYRLTVLGSRFRNNHATDFGGAVFVWEMWRDVLFSGCLFGGNEAQTSGALHLDRPTSFGQLNLQDTVVVMNRAQICGSTSLAMSPHWTAARIDRSVFAGNSADGSTPSAGALCVGSFFSNQGEVKISDSVFTSNRAASGTGGVSSSQRSFQLARTMFLGNSAGGDDQDATGGALALRGVYVSGYQAGISDSVVAGNLGRWGGAISVREMTLDATNITFVGNVTDEEGGSIYTTGFSAAVWISNSILWDNESPDGSQFASYGAFAGVWANHCLVEGGYSGEGNLDADPRFAAYPNPQVAGTWSQVVYDPETFQTQLTDAVASWVPGELVGLYLKPNASDPRWLWIVDNDDTNIVVWADVSDWVAPGNDYAVFDLRLSPTSPAIDMCDTSTASATDLDGNLRVDVPGVGSATAIVDSGAYEYQP